MFFLLVSLFWAWGVQSLEAGYPERGVRYESTGKGLHSLDAASAGLSLS